MTDKELLELAAKAAGIDAEHGIHERGYDSMWVGAYEWNPLIDDGDALRLAVKLKLDINHWGACVCAGVRNEQFDEVEFEDCEDEMAATRRAIVLAAAEIGRTMK